MKKLFLLTIIALLSASVTFNISCNSLPPNEDYDSDGLINKIDPKPKNNNYEVKLNLKNGTMSQPIDIKVDYHDFIADNFNKNLALLSSFFINAADGVTPTFDVVYKPSLSEKIPILSQIGCKDIVYLETALIDNQDPYDTASIYLGHHTFIDENENKYQIFFGIVDGYLSRVGWVSDFDIGAWDNDNNKITDGYRDFWNTDKHDGWTHHKIHKGFDVTANRLIEQINKYVGEHMDNDAKKVMIFAGHSRGAAIANLLGKYYIDEGVDAKAFCFNSPAITKEENNEAKYKNIFVLTNTNDVVSRLPAPNYWDFAYYGKSYNVDIETNGKKLFKDYYGYDYMGNSDEFLNVIEMMLADFSCVEPPVEEKIDYTDSNNMFDGFHYENHELDYNEFEDISSVETFKQFVKEHCSNLVSLNKIDELKYSWESKGALLIRATEDILVKKIPEAEEYYLILFYRLIVETISELISRGALPLPIDSIADRIMIPHDTSTACILVMSIQ